MQKINYLERLADLCPQNIKCKDDDCNQLHPRCFAGVCILHLQKKEDNCNGYLLHLTNKDLRGYLRQEKINGVYFFNLCKKQNDCEDQKNCRYLHRKWAVDMCIDQLSDECQNKKECKLNHDLDWKQLKQRTYQFYNQNEINPEDIENGKQHKLPISDICLEYLCGECQFQKSCTKNHIDWECLLNNKNFKETRRRQCYFDLSMLSDVQQSKQINDEVFNQYIEKIHNIQIKKQVKKAQVIDVLFIIDCTGSMQRWLKSAKENIHKIIKEFQQNIDKKKIIVRTAIVAYRDFDDEDNLLYREFTTESKVIEEFLAKLQAKGGGDDAENVIGALEKGIRLNISKDQESVLCSFLICDSPSHGPYHKDLKDDYYDKVQAGDLEKIMQRYHALKAKNFFTCFRICDKTDIMFTKMKTGFPSLIITETTLNNFSESVLFSLKTSLQNSQAKTSKQSQNIKIRARFSKTKPLELNNYLLKDDNVDYWKNFLEQQELNKIEGETQLIINNKQEDLSDNEKGSQCQIFKLFDIVLNRKLVLKLPNFVISKFNQKQQLSPKELKDYESFINTRYTALLIAQQLAESFRMQTQSIQGAPPIFYVSPIKYELETSFMGVNQLFAETYIDLANFSEWKKYTNNTIYADENEYYYTAFSHYSYLATNKKLIITDLQGKNNILSDPCIHSKDQQIVQFIKDTSNFEETGLKNFFCQQHTKCHEICKRLNLDIQSESQQISESFTNEEQKKNQIWQKQPDDIINVICQICGELKDVSYEDYFKENSCICENCLEDKDPISLTCSCCRKNFQCFYNQQIKIGIIQEICNQCKQNCKKGDWECCYCQCQCIQRTMTVKIKDIGITVCKEGKRFLNALQCHFCHNLYDFETYITPENYKKSFYCCPTCEQK
ncbi:unnamed protein product [Paramecium sonneborni]|uniref:Alpha-type protein kinase domain-containing protein n=1 Tax=Paramecium sonneborni TaxID=65129 RepID=A0A8S1K5D8_9CILI|nr:unnamed protein product [Paramecium sonneborni]